jgi:hypothetical protein
MNIPYEYIERLFSNDFRWQDDRHADESKGPEKMTDDSPEPPPSPE